MGDGQLGLGCNKLASGQVGITGANGSAMIRAALEHGIRFFDTADAYSSGWSERRLGQSLGRVDGVCVATKVGYVFRPRGRVEHLARAAAGSLRDRRRGGEALPAHAAQGGSPGSGAYAVQEFGLDVVRRRVRESAERLRRRPLDLLQLHDPPPGLARSAAAFVADLKGGGFCQRFGVATGDLAVAAEWLETRLVDSIQIPFGLLDPEGLPVVQAASPDITVIVRGVFGGGTLGRTGHAHAARRDLISSIDSLAAACGVTRFQLAAWYVRLAAPRCVWLVGASSLAQVVENSRMFDAPLPSADVCARVWSLADRCSETGGST